MLRWFPKSVSITHKLWFTLFIHSLLPAISSHAQPITLVDMDSFHSFLREPGQGILVVSDDHCGKCLEAKTPEFLKPLSDSTQRPVAYADARGEFGMKFRMKHRINRLPAFAIVDGKGQVLKKSYRFPENGEDFRRLATVKDTLPPLDEPLNFEWVQPEFLVESYRTERFTAPLQSELDRYFKSVNDITDPAPWAVVMRFSVSDDVMERVLRSIALLIEKYGETEVYQKFDEYLFGKTKEAIRSKGGGPFPTELEDRCLRFFEDRANEESLKLKTYFYQMTGQWDAIASLGSEIYAKSMIDRERLTSIAKILLRSTTDTQLLSIAIDWMGEDTKEMTPERMEVKAGLHLACGENEEARAWAAKAKEKGTRLGLETPIASQILSEVK